MICHQLSLLQKLFVSMTIHLCGKYIRGQCRKKTKFRLRYLMKFTWQTTKVTFFSFYLQLLFILCNKEASNNFVFSLSIFEFCLCEINMFQCFGFGFWFFFFHFVRFHLHKALDKSKEFLLQYFIC